MKNTALNIVQKRWRMRIFLKCLTWLALIAVCAFLLDWMTNLEWFWLLGAATLSIVFIGLELRRLPTQDDLIRLVNRQFDQVEYSTDLLFITPTNELHALQQMRVNAALKQQLPAFEYPVRWKDLLITTIVLTVGIVGGTLLFGGSSSENIEVGESASANLKDETFVPIDSVFMTSHRAVVRPPAYTQLKSKSYESLDISVPEQSFIRWDLKFNGSPNAVWLSINGGDSLALTSKDELYQVGQKVLKSSLYTINYLDDKDRLVSSPYYELNVVPDEAPEIVVNGIPPFQRLDYKRGISIDVNVSIADDYGLTDGYIVATITKGAGESVKFREQKIALPGKVGGKKIVRPVSFDLDKLDMEPGNELYFYVTAFDNKIPKAQQSRTDTYFIILKDTAKVEFSLQGALGVDLMPDFFRSQLQIIIDTKKLIEDKNQLSAYDFNFESNALGYDQKQLRLKYGQFIGEEEDSGLEVEEELIEPSTDGEDVLSEFGHDTDAENEEGQWMDRGTEADHDHEHEGHQEEESPLEQFMHNHEDEETATFYTQSLKSKLRAALNEMWDAELYLRLYKPKESLPYQLKAQELLKEIRNHARIYVQRIGFDPPPVNVDESRLTGELKELNQLPFKGSVDKEQLYPAIREAIRWVEQNRFKPEWNTNAKSILKRAGDELAGLAIKNPGKYLSTLNDLKLLLDTELLNEKDHKQLLKLQKVLEDAIPKENVLPPAGDRSDDEYTDAFIQSLTNNSDR
jgi:hypothetical protein